MCRPRSAAHSKGPLIRLPWRTCLTALHLGVRTFDASAGGLGGCPYAPGATGNLATEDLLYMLDGLGIETGVSIERVLAASRFIEAKLGHPLASRYAAAVRHGAEP